jgi:hypothetical protein
MPTARRRDAKSARPRAVIESLKSADRRILFMLQRRPV